MFSTGNQENLIRELHNNWSLELLGMVKKVFKKDFWRQPRK